ncbi:hypothetical protein FHS43_000592 [Streptosporangium becharense]|uniref:DUF397 domain-containing protein n=1 Tax=Streptosporangium becharense TaxID=1816182 RepID=A0A7W9MKH8_9ACTN|nr:DUF397 domain-containing protein [Streptosporangium becharense]MBB2909346.1 hypothetical protein [Streptosporangium becharense]MBB5823751.1 hypothetical protein [Streptosporangium becharense]
MELTPSALAYRKSSFSGPNDNCVEVAELPDGGRAVRNSKRPHEAPVTYTKNEWDAFVLGVKAGEFD